MRVKGFKLHDSPPVYVAAVPGAWLLEHSTPSWRSKDPKQGFQRIVNEKRARQIAVSVLDQGRTFPNAVVLATDVKQLKLSNGQLLLKEDMEFLVVDGQHRLWAQKFTESKVDYATIIHTGLDEVTMAELFLEINDNQKRVPSSLRWDLVRLVRPEDDPIAIEATELIFELNSTQGGPLYQRIDLTGEQAEISLKQGSLAPELIRLLKHVDIKDLSFEEKFDLLDRYLTALRVLSPDDWDKGKSPFYKARVLRAMIRVMPLVLEETGVSMNKVKPGDILKVLERIDTASLNPEAIRSAQGSAGIKAIYEQVREQIR